MFKIIFLTSSNVKMSHVTYLMKDYDVELVPPPDYGKPYHEPRIYDRARLLDESLNDANQRLARNISILKQEITVSEELKFGFDGHDQASALTSDHQHKIFFIEDTSVRIDALSKTQEVPGVDIKYWMRDNDFDSVDRMLKKRRNNRVVSVRSDIVLYLPPALRDGSGQIYKIFTGVVNGSIAQNEVKFERNSLYPWLDNKSFNKWFIPEGSDRVFSQLSIDRSLEFDFRKIAIDEMLFFLANKGLVRKRGVVPPPQTQGELFLSQDFIFCGPTCSGKTVLAFLISRKYGYQHIEASDFMRKAFLDRHGLDSDVSIHEFAKETLDSDPGIVANQVADYIISKNPYRFIITGFRSSKEVEVINCRLNRSDIKIIYIDSSIELRYERSMARGRNDKANSFEEFQYQNELQEQMGLSDLRATSAVITNESGLTSYLKGSVKGLITSDEYVDKLNYLALSKKTFLPLEQVLMIALLLQEGSGNTPLTTSEAAKVVTRNFLNLRIKASGETVGVNKNNVSRFFNQKSNIHFRAVKTDKGIKYQLSQTGKSAALAILRSLNRK